MLSDRDRCEIQRLVLYGSACPHLRYHFFSVREAVEGRRFAQALLEHGSPLHVSTAGRRDTDTRSASHVFAGFTWQGLRALHVSSVALNSFPPEFTAGAQARAAELGDAGASAPSAWLFDADQAHIAVLIYAHDQEQLDDLSRQLLERATIHNCDVVSMLDAQALPDSPQQSGELLTQPVGFGFSDGLSQPEILPAPERTPGDPLTMPPSMFVLGHPDGPQHGESDAVANQPMPLPTYFSNNGTYGAFRMLELDVDAYEGFLDANSTTAESRELLATQISADTHDGAPVRLIRRGMPYGPPYDPAHSRDGIPRGMLELFLCASLTDQFEGTVRQTTALPRFASTRAAAYLFFPSVTGLRFITQLDEHLPTEHEQQATEEAVDFVVQAMKQALGSSTTRDAHPKHHGLVRATFDIAADLPETLRYGLFAKPQSFHAYIRFSNGRPAPVFPPDAAPDVRGLAIKLLGVSGAKEAQDETHTHDFILASHPVFFVPDVHTYVDFLKLPTLAEKMRLFPELPRSFRSFDSPLTIRYFSQTPYALGPYVVKYQVQPIEPAEQPPMTLTPEQIASRPPHYLREAMAVHLASQPAKLALCVQLAPDRSAEQVDDATRLWDTEPIRVATISIPVQDFTRQANDHLAETLSFSPWHCLHEHRPLGSVNLARRRVYREASVQRHANRAVLVKEPDGVHDLD